jgi:hypothetical protein
MNVDDPRMTAFALGEIQGSEQAALRSAILNHEELQQEVAAITDLADQLGDALRAESAALRLDPGQRLALLTIPRPPRPINPLPAFIPAFGVAVAASIAIALWLTTYATREPVPTKPGLSVENGSAEVPTPQMTVSLIPPEHAIGMQPVASDLPPPSLPDTALIPQNRPRPSAASGPQWNITGQQYPAERHPSTAANLTDRFAQFGTHHPAAPHKDQATYGGNQQFTLVSDAPVMGLSMNAVTGAFSLRQLHETAVQSRFLQPGAIRLEQMINHFDYAYPASDPGDVFALGVELGRCPWAKTHILAKIDAVACINGNREAGPAAHSAGLEVTFDSARIRSYRLLGFNQQETLDPKAFLASGQVPAGRMLTVLYELIPARKDFLHGSPHKGSPPEDYPAAEVSALPPAVVHADMLYRTRPRGVLQRSGRTSAGSTQSIDQCSDDFRFATAVAAFVLRIDGDGAASKLALDEIIELAQSGGGDPPAQKRSEFIRFMETAGELALP